MKKKIAASLIRWVMVLLCLLITAVFQNRMWAVAAVCFWITIPMVTWLVNFLIKDNLTVTVQLPATVSKGQAAFGTLTIINQSHLYVGRIFCQLQLRNCLTEEVEFCCLELSAAGKTSCSTRFQMQSYRCGYLQASVKKLYFMDWLGFLPVRGKTIAKAGCGVLPDTFVPNLYLDVPQMDRSDSETWSQIQKGTDASQVFGLRDYVPGDGLNRIHWKLSSKRQRLVVKESSMPVEKSLLLFWNKNMGESTPKEMDAMAEVVASIAQQLCSLGYVFTIGWTQGKESRYEEITEEEQLLQTIPQMLKLGQDNRDTYEDINTETNWEQDIPNGFRKTILIAREMSKKGVEEGILSPFGEVTWILCDSGQQENAGTGISFSGDTYQEDLASIQL